MVIKHGYLTPPERLDMPVVQYDFTPQAQSAMGWPSEADLNRELKAAGLRRTSSARYGICATAQRRDDFRQPRSNMPKERLSVCFRRTTRRADYRDTSVARARDARIDNFAQRFRYSVNVSVLTTGFDAPHVDPHRDSTSHRVS